MEASQHEYSLGSISINPINTKLRIYDGNSGTLSPLGQYGMSIYYLELGKTQSRKEQKKIEMEIYSIILDALFQFHK